MREPIIKSGDKYGRLTAIEFHHKVKTNQYWLFKCECGVEKVIYVGSVKKGETKSCGCIKKKGANYKHGMSRTLTCRTWAAMKTRCLNKNNKFYNYYGGRGIKVCDRWLNSFENFYADMGKQPKNKSLDRINNNGNYCPENCRYATREEQMNNTRYNHLLTFNSRTQTMAQWARELNINYTTISSRIRMGWSVEKTLK